MLNNTLIVKEGRLYSGITKTERSIPQGADDSMTLWNGYFNTIIQKMKKFDLGILIPKYELGTEPLFTISEDNNIIDLENEKNEKNLVDIEFDEQFGHGINTKNIKLDIFFIILIVILFCDDSTIIANLPNEVQQLLLIMAELGKQLGLEMHPLKGQRLTLGRKHLNEYEKKYRNYMIDYRNNDKKIFIEEVNIIGAKYLGHYFKVKNGMNGKDLDFNPHINKMEITCNNTMLYLNNLGFNKYINKISMKSMIFKSLIESKMCFGSRSFHPNNTQSKKLTKIENNYYKQSAKLYRTTSNIIARLIYSNRPIIGTWDINLLKQYYHITVEMKQKRNHLTYYKLYYKQIHNDVLKQSKNNSFISKGLIYDIYFVLNKYGLNKYFDINILPKNKNEWEKLIINTIENYYFEKDMKYIEESNNMFMKSLLKLNNINGYDNKLSKIIDNYLNDKSDKIRSISLRVLSWNVPTLWKKYKLENCPLCYKKWTTPLLHIFSTCANLKDTNLNIIDRRILNLETISSIIYDMVEKNYDEIVKLSIKIENK